MFVRSRIAGVLALMLPVLVGASGVFAHDADLSETEAVLLVARPELRDPVYGETIVIASPVGQGRHVGFILNRPTTLSIKEAIPGHTASLAGGTPLYLGGPADVGSVFALVQSHDSPGPGSMQLAPDVFLVIAADAVDHVIEFEAEHARFFAGAVTWQTGELDDELKRGVWYVLDPEPELVLPHKTDGMWQQLLQRAKLRENGI